MFATKDEICSGINLNLFTTGNIFSLIFGVGGGALLLHSLKHTHTHTHPTPTYSHMENSISYHYHNVNVESKSNQFKNRNRKK